MKTIVLIIAVFTFSLPARAKLGEGAITSIDQKVSEHQNYSLSEIANSDGYKTREFLNSSKIAFAICWQGPKPPQDMSELFGSIYVEKYMKAVAQAPRQRGQRFLSIKNPDLVTKQSSHPRIFRGCAYDPKLVPAGVATNEIN
jgi:uncharacterized protein DUF2844